MDLILDKVIIFIIENYWVIITLLEVFSAALALLAWYQIRQGWKFYFSKRRLIAKLREKNL